MFLLIEKLFAITWFDFIPVTLTVIAIVLIKLINTTEQLLKTDKATAIVANHTNFNGAPTTTILYNNNNKKLEKQLSDFIADEKNLNTPTPPNSPNVITNNGHIPQTFGWSNDANDEYHEDEDTISLENLFPCDQTEIYASKKIRFIIEELIQTERNYVNSLRTGIKNYGQIYQRADVPEALKTIEKQQQLLNNTEDILQLHEAHVLPLMIKNQYDLKQLFDDFAKLFDKNDFYCYVIFSMNKKVSMDLRQEHREWFLSYQSEIRDRLGVDSFLVQPIQRLTRYPLLFKQFMHEYYKSHINCKPVLRSLCKLDTRMGRLLTAVDQAQALGCLEELPTDLHITQLGDFRQSTEFDVYHCRLRKKYHAKVFLFERCLLCAEVRKQRLAYRQHYLWESIELQQHDNDKHVKVVSTALKDGKIELELSTPVGMSIKKWLQLVAKIMEDARREAETTISVPTEIVLSILFTVWSLWYIL